MTEPYAMRDPTAETEPVDAPARRSADESRRPHHRPAFHRQGAVGGISGHGGVDCSQREGLNVLRFAKPTHTKPAPRGVIQDLVERCDIVVEGLAD